MQKVIAKKEGYGLALLRDDKLISGEVMRGHTGNAYGLHSAMFFHPGKEFGFVVITNGCKPSYVDDMNVVLRATINALYQNFIRR